LCRDNKGLSMRASASTASNPIFEPDCIPGKYVAAVPSVGRVEVQGCGMTRDGAAA
jgi:hypothetical protein